MELLIACVLGAALLIISLGFMRNAVQLHGGWPGWNADISRGVKRLWGGTYVIALAISIVIFGPASLLVAWPFLACGAAVWGFFALVDRLTGVGKSKPKARPPASYAQIDEAAFMEHPSAAVNVALDGAIVYITRDGPPLQLRVMDERR